MATTDKYDRQTRLWGSNGQRLLGEATIIMLGTSSAGTECLKNLVLPGAGHFMIVDDKKVDARDCGNDFFVTQDKIGTNKAKVVAELMKEMNPDVKTGNYMDMAVAEFIERTDMILDAQNGSRNCVNTSMYVNSSHETEKINGQSYQNFNFC